MAYSPQEQIAFLQPLVEPVQPEDTMAEAGRKILLRELVRMLQHEQGSRSGDDIEDVHDMRVAIRRTRSAMRLLKPYLKGKAIRPYNRGLRHLGWVLGEVRDLDVMIENLKTYQTALDAEAAAAFQLVIDELDQRRALARDALNEYLDAKAYRRFIRDYSDFLTQPMREGRHAANGAVAPYQVRHVLPAMIYDRLAAVRAYDTVLPEANAGTLHALRIEFKRLRYTLSLFSDVLGSSAEEFVDTIKAIQDHLGHLNDSSVARARLEGLADDPEASYADVLAGYLAHLEAHEAELKAGFAEVWQRFNSRKVQQKLATAVLALR